MTDINLKSMPATAAKTQPQALKGRHHVMHGCNPCNTPRLTKTLLLALLLALLAPGAANAQNRTIVTIGVGTYTHNFPLPGFYAYHYSVYLYTPSAAPALDIDCDISSIAFNVSTNSTKTGARMYIWVKDVDADYALAEATTFSQYTAGATQVYENDDFSSTLGWNTFAFTSDFSHEGGKALLVAVYGVGCSDIGGCQRRCYYTTAPNTFWSKHADLNDPGTNVSGSVDERRADIQLNLTYTGCLSPSGLAVSNITDNSATLSWTETGEATAWQICVNDDEENLIDADTNPYTLTGLTPETEYTVKVRANCGSEQSAWSNGLTFTTPCGAFALPYSYGFEDAGDLNCWEVIATSPYTGITTANDAPEGEKVFLFYYNERNAYLASPVFSGTEQGLDVAFQYMNSSTTTNYTEQFQVGYTTDAGAAPADFTYGETIYGENHWVMYENTFPPNTKRIAIKYIYTYGMYLRLDDFNFESTSCPIPTDLTAGTPEPHSVELGWTETGEATAWQICVNDDEENLIDADTNPYTLTGLNPVTEYTVKVRANCGAEQSAWSTGLTFTTLEACPVPFDVAASDIAPTEVAISWTGYSDSYNLSYRRVPSTAEPLLSEGFEGGTMPQGWIIEGASQDPAKTWRVGVGDYNTGTGTHSGSYNALITHNTNNQVTYLVTPAIDLGGYGSAELSFWYINRKWINDIDEFAVCYRIGNEGEWNELWSTAENHQGWTSQSVELTGLADNYQIGFRFTDHWGYGVGLDDIALSEWITLNEAESPQTIVGLKPETEYEVKVQGICDGIPTEWSESVYFSTPARTVDNLEVSDITATGATLTWTGTSVDYNVRVGTFLGSEMMVDEDFAEAIPADWDNNSDYPWTIVDGHMQSSNGGIYSTSSAISLTLTFPFGGTIDFDAECMGEGGGHSSVFDMCIFTIDGEQQFCYGDNMPGWNHYSYLVNAGEHTFTWSYTKDNSIQPPGDYFAVDNVVAVAFYYSWDAPLLASGESITFSALTPSTTYYAQVQGNCIPTGWSDIVTFTTLEQTAVTQTTTLTAGWNWWSTYLDITLDDLKAALVEALPGTNITIKSRNNGYTTYNGSMWRGALSSLDVTQMYMIQASTACEIMLQGMPINPAEHTVTIRPGVNWIAFPLGASMSVTNAFAGFAVANDAIKSKSNGYTTFNGTMWRGSLNTLQPGAGYIYQSNSTVNRFFNFPTGTK